MPVCRHGISTPRPHTFIRRGTELDGAYEDTLSDELLGTLGAFVGAIIVDRTTGRTREEAALSR
ncbi:hypothetical protein [Aeromicrobium chenweiae]|uniref:hypothetical protein n=1 Tax=Aeromicrobium chenweiae TaxID=2079793 RepID=UPI001092B75E|nr:hypothetical protein [Aeromicrobium chenweiae]TGN33656.1 hypothetical protein E4L97_00945 [Aeromicrobium chenweiae]